MPDLVPAHGRTMMFLALSLLIVGVAGCGESNKPGGDVRSQFLLSESPGKSDLISRIRTKLKADDGPKQLKVVLSGAAYAGKDMEPWEEGKTAFMLTVMGDHGESAHDPHECKYCSDHIEDYMVFAQFKVDGKVPDIDSRVAFGLKEKQMVTVTGQASLDEDGLVKIDAAGLFLED